MQKRKKKKKKKGGQRQELNRANNVKYVKNNVFLRNSSMKNYSSRSQKQNEDFVKGNNNNMTLVTSEATFGVNNDNKTFS